MKRMLIAAVLAAVVGFSAGAGFAAGPEPVGISLLKIEYKKSLIQQDAAPKQTALRKKKLEELQAAGKTDEAADAEVDYIQAQGAEAMVNLTVKELELQLKDAQAAASAPPPTAPQPGAMPPGAAQPAGGAPAGAAQDQEPPASPTEISLLQLDLQKAQVQADVAKKIADNRQGLLAAKQAKVAAGLEDAESDALGAATAARVAALDVEAAQMRVDAAVKSAAPKK